MKFLLCCVSVTRSASRQVHVCITAYGSIEACSPRIDKGFENSVLPGAFQGCFMDGSTIPTRKLNVDIIHVNYSIRICQ